MLFLFYNRKKGADFVRIINEKRKKIIIKWTALFVAVVMILAIVVSALLGGFI